jgi:hypothetical protein
MSSIIRNGDTYHGISVFGRGVFTNDKYGATYAGQCKDGHACGLAVVTYSSGTKDYAEYGPDGQFDGRYFGRSADGTTGYWLYERGKQKDVAYVWADGTCGYNGVPCAPDDPRVLALIAQVAPVEVRPAAQASQPPSSATQTNQSSDGSAGSFCICRRWRPPWPPRCTRTPHAVAGGCATQPYSSHTAKHVHAVTRTQAIVVSREAPSCTLTTAAWCAPMGPSRQRRCHAVVQHAAC